MTAGTDPGALIALDGNLNLRDLGGWPTASGPVVRGRIYRSDRLSALTDADHGALDQLGIATVIDLRYEAEVAEHPSRLWAAVSNHHEIPMGGDLADQRSFIQRALDGDFDEISDDDVGESYVDMLGTHAADFGRAVEILLDDDAALFHCTAGKDRTGLLAMLLLSTAGVSDADVLTDFELSNEYRATTRMAQLRPTFEANGLDVERFRPALSAPRPALERAMAWIEADFGSPECYLSDAAGLTDPVARIQRRLLSP